MAHGSRILIVLLVCICMSFDLCGQQPGKVIPEDSAKVYKALKEIADKKSFSKWLFSLIVIIPEKSKSGASRKPKKRIAKPYESFEGKIIRNIDILTLDPFGYDIRDTSVTPKGFLKNDRK
ncbi:MAG: hypothetical protein HC830_03475 [Bacteroidetes bacterium]|nr:hypothetical protein [Bacteroidota bacterium]